MRFNDWRGRNVRLSRDGRTAIRTESFNHGLTMTSDILLPNTLFQVHRKIVNGPNAGIILYVKTSLTEKYLWSYRIVRFFLTG